MENFNGAAEKMGFRRHASKDMLTEMFNRVAYVPTDGEHIDALDEPRKLKLAWLCESG